MLVRLIINYLNRSNNMANKKLLISFLLIALVALSLSTVSAADDFDVAVADDAAIAIDEAAPALADGAGDTIPTKMTGDELQKLIDDAKEGDSINLDNVVVNVSKSITIDKEIKINGKEATIIGDGSQFPDGAIIVDGASSVKISGLKFINTDLNPEYTKYNDNTKIKPVGIAIDIINGASGTTVEGCTFSDWWNSGVALSSARTTTIQKNTFMGGTATFINNIPDGPKDRGTYHISAMSSTGTFVYDNEFLGTVCDGVSVAGNSLGSTIEKNTFVDNAYSIYFGGKSTEGTKITKNTFINSGWFESEIYKDGVPTGKNVSFFDLPVISVQKSSDSFTINDNTFYARNGNILVKALEGSTAHGGSSAIGNITIVDNTVLPLKDCPLFVFDEETFMPSVTLAYIETKNALIRPVGEIKIANNTLNGAKSSGFWNQNWGDVYGDVSITAPSMINSILYVPSDSKALSGEVGVFKGTLTGSDNGQPIVGQLCRIVINGKNYVGKTDENGTFAVNYTYTEAKPYVASFWFPGTDFEYRSNFISTKVLVIKKSVTISTPSPTYKVSDNKKISITMTDELGKPAAGKTLTFTVNGKTYTGYTNADGVATFNPTINSKGTFSYSVNFAGDSGTFGKYATGKIVVQ